MIMSQKQPLTMVLNQRGDALFVECALSVEYPEFTVA